MDGLRVIDFGVVSPLRSQSIWHGLTSAAEPTTPTTLAFMSPEAPYVGIGAHRSHEELNWEAIQSMGIGVIRRMVGGGSVYLDADQLFFQVIAPLGRYRGARSAIINRLLTPFLAAYAAVGLDAMMDSTGEIVVGDTKVCGHGAGEIDGGMAVVGNLIQHFDASTAASVLATPHPMVVDVLSELMGRFVASARPTGSQADFVTSASISLSAALELESYRGVVSDSEWRSIEEFDQKLSAPESVLLPEFPPAKPIEPHIIKVRSGVYAVFPLALSPIYVLTVVFGLVERLVVLRNGVASDVVEVSGRLPIDAIEVLHSMGIPAAGIEARLAGVGALNQKETVR